MGRILAVPLLIACFGLAASLGVQKDDFKRYKDADDAKQAALEGKTAPKIVATEWLNSTPLSLDKLKGKVVLIDIWAYW